MASVYDSVKQTRNRIAKAVADVGVAAAKVVGSDDYKKNQENMEIVYDVFADWNYAQTVYSQLESDMAKHRSFYLGDKNEQWSGTPDGDLQIVANMGATVIDLFVYILSNNYPYVQFIPESANKDDQVKASYYEDQTKKLFSDAKFAIRFRDSVKLQFVIGFCIILALWNKDNKDGGEKGTWEISTLNPFTTRVCFSGTDYEKIDAVLTVKRMSPREIERKYNFKAITDTESKVIPQTYQMFDDKMASVFRRYTDKYTDTVINGQLVSREENKYGVLAAMQINNIIVPNDANGHSEIERWLPIAQELNSLISIASEIARDLGYPPILEYNNALGGRHITKWRGQKIPVRKSDKGEAVEFMLNTAQITPLLNQIRLLIDLFHFVSLMPKAAAGVFEPSITSGFQAKLAMQPATLTTESRKIDWDNAIKQFVKFAFMMLKEEDPEALKIDNTIMPIPALHQMQVVWPENLPIDIAREIQNLVVGIQNNLTSVHQSIDKYNVMMGMGSVSDTEEYLRQESNDTDLAPDRALKIADVKQKLASIKATMDQASEKFSQLRGQLNNGENPNNMLKGMTSKLPEEQRVTSETADAVPTESTGGKVLPPAQ